MEDSGSFLVRTGLINRDELDPLRRDADERGMRLLEALVLSGRVDDEALTEALHRDLSLPRVAANDLANIPTPVIESVPSELCVEHRLIPVAYEGSRLDLAMSDPCDQGALDEVAFFTEAQVAPTIATQRQIAWCLAHYHGVITSLGETLLERAKTSPTPPGAGVTPRRRRPSRRPPTERDDDVELQPRVGEIAVRSEAEATPDSSREYLPAVVLDDSLELRDALRRDGAGDDASVPELRDESEDEVVAIPADRQRHRSNTRIGIPPPGRRSTEPADADVDREDEITTEPGRYPPPSDEMASVDSLDDDPAYEQIEANATPRLEAATPALLDDGADATIPSERPFGALTAEPGAGAHASFPGELDLPPAPDSEPALPDEEDDFGPPGTTIPPAFLGAIPQSYDDLDSGVIPLQAIGPDDDESHPHQAAADASDRYRELETASAELMRTLRALEDTAHRDGVIDTLVEHNVRHFDRAAFFVIKAGSLVLWASRGSGGESAPSARLSEIPSLAATARGGRPFRGAVTDAASRGFLSAWLSAVPDEILAVPITVRQRVVGILYGDTPTRRVFDEHVAVLIRAAGDAFERVLRARKQSTVPR